MRIAFTNLWRPPGASPTELVERDATRRGLGAALVARGHEVTVVQEHPEEGTLSRDGVNWRFVAPSPLARATRRALAAAGHGAPMVVSPATHLVAPLRAIAPDVIHCFDLSFAPTLAILTALGPPVVAHYHGGEPARLPGARAAERVAVRRVARTLFTTADRAEGWIRRGLDPSKVVEVPETSTFFTPGDRAAARRRLGLPGGFVLLCPGRLDPVKDPLTTVRGFARVARARPDARLWMAYTAAPLLGDVRAEIARLGVADRVELLGELPHARMEDVFRAADLVVQSSVREVCGVATLEAAATGAVPVLSDIPPFRLLLDDGRCGRLFPVGDPAALAAAVLSVGDPANLSAAILARFRAHYAFPALAAQVEAVYRDVTRRPSPRG